MLLKFASWNLRGNQESNKLMLLFILLGCLSLFFSVTTILHTYTSMPSQETFFFHVLPGDLNQLRCFPFYNSFLKISLF